MFRQMFRPAIVLALGKDTKNFDKNNLLNACKLNGLAELQNLADEASAVEKDENFGITIYPINWQWAKSQVVQKKK